jgi:hypothetical protein
MNKNTKHPELAKIDFLIGKWKTQGTVLGDNTAHEVRFEGSDAYEWVCDGSFILHTVDVVMGDQPVNTIELIGFDHAHNKYSFRSFDNNGNFLTMHGSFNDVGAFVVMTENMRSTLTVHQPEKMMSAFWEQSKDGKMWVPWMSLTLAK